MRNKLDRTVTSPDVGYYILFSEVSVMMSLKSIRNNHCLTQIM
jgi:hypothetical protein